jgi:hypothetical protein
MKKLAMLCVLVGCVFASTSPAKAGVVTLSFDPNDLIDLYPADLAQVKGRGKALQLNPRRVHETYKSTYYGTFNDNMQTGHTQPSDYNTYMNWRDGLTGENEGIATFNNWFLGYTGAGTWGETWVVKPGTVASGVSDVGWNWRVITDPYSPTDGSCIQWWTTDPTKYIRNGGMDIGDFSVTVDLYEDTNGDNHWDAGDADVNPGDTIRMWLGDLNGDDAPYYRNDTQAIYFDDQSWGSRSGDPAFTAIYSTGANSPIGSGFEGVLTVTAQAVSELAVPEPATMTLWGLGSLGLLFWMVRTRKWRR